MRPSPSAGPYASLPVTHVGLNEPSHSHIWWFELLWQTGSSWSEKWLLWPIVAELCAVLEGHTGWSSAVGLSWASSLWAGRAGPWFTASLNGPWESSVMDSLGLHTLALCISVSWTLSLSLFFFFSHTMLYMQTHTHFSSHKCLFFPPLSSWYRCGETSLCCKAWHCHYKQSLTCLCLSLSFLLSFM